MGSKVVTAAVALAFAALIASGTSASADPVELGTSGPVLDHAPRTGT